MDYLTMNGTIQHYANPLHVYCRLRDIGVPKRVAVCLCRSYEQTVFKHVMGKESEIKEPVDIISSTC